MINGKTKRWIAFLLALCLIPGAAWLGTPFGTAHATKYSGIDPGEVYTMSPEKITVILNALQTAVNTITVKKHAPEAVTGIIYGEFLMELNCTIYDSATAIKKAALALMKSGYKYKGTITKEFFSVTKAAGGKYKIALLDSNNVTSPVKSDIPKAIVEKPTLCTHHEMNDKTQPTCTEYGRCYICDTVLKAPLGHEEETVPAVEPTCTEEGSTAGTKCARCGVTLVSPEPVPALGHEWSEWENVEVQDGRMLQRRVCTRDEAHEEFRYMEIDIPSPFAAPTTEPETEPAHIHEGGEATYTERAVFAAPTTEPETESAHIHEGGEATCTERAVCAVCGQPYGEPLGHEWGEWTPIEGLENGMKRSCARCIQTQDGQGSDGQGSDSQDSSN